VPDIDVCVSGVPYNLRFTGQGSTVPDLMFVRSQSEDWRPCVLQRRGGPNHFSLLSVFRLRSRVSCGCRRFLQSFASAGRRYRNIRRRHVAIDLGLFVVTIRGEGLRVTFDGAEILCGFFKNEFIRAKTVQEAEATARTNVVTALHPCLCAAEHQQGMDDHSHLDHRRPG